MTMAPPLSAGLMMIVSLSTSDLRASFSAGVMFFRLGALILVSSKPSSLMLIMVSKLLGPVGGIQLDTLLSLRSRVLLKGPILVFLVLGV